MNELTPPLSLDLLISFVFAFLLFFFLYVFENKKPCLKIYNYLFLSFIFSFFFNIYDPQILGNTLLNWAFFFFFLFSFATYKNFGENLDFYYFIIIMFFSVNSGFYFFLANYKDLILPIVSSTFFIYLTLLLSFILIIYHKLAASKNNKIFFCYIIGALYLSENLFLNGNITNISGKFLLISFFVLHFMNAKEQAYLPLIKRMKKLETQVEKFEAEMPLHIQKKIQILENNKAKLLDMANTDKMTGVFNKGKITAALKNLIADNKTEKFSILMFDIDNFKNINDTLGHLVGDECIVRLAKIGTNSIRKNDYIGRYGGDEFLVIFPKIGALEAKVIAERFRSRVSQESDPKFTISIGIASYPDDGNTFKELVENADKALYLSKERGKNKVSHAILF